MKQLREYSVKCMTWQVVSSTVFYKYFNYVIDVEKPVINFDFENFNSTEIVTNFTQNRGSHPGAMKLRLVDDNNGKLIYHPSRAGRLLYCPRGYWHNLPEAENNVECITTDINPSADIIKCLT